MASLYLVNYYQKKVQAYRNYQNFKEDDYAKLFNFTTKKAGEDSETEDENNKLLSSFKKSMKVEV